MLASLLMKDDMRNLRILFLIITALGAGCQSQPTEQTAKDESFVPAPVNDKDTIRENALSNQEKKEGWVLLFDGSSTEQWRGAHKDHFPQAGWKVEDGNLVVMESGGAESQHGGDIVTKDEYGNFHLVLDFKLTEGANSGIKYFVTEAYDSKASAIGLEYQILDDARHPDAKKGNNGKGTRTISSLYDLIAADSQKKVKPIGSWNHAEIIVQGGHVEHWLNGEKVLSYERGSDHYKELVKNSKYKHYKDFGLADKGHILLQDHGNKVYFKNIKIKPLPAS